MLRRNILIIILLALIINMRYDVKLKVIDNDDLEYNYFTYHEQYVKHIKESINIQKIQVSEKRSLSRGGDIEEIGNQNSIKSPQYEVFTLTFYTDLVKENSKYGPVNCKGRRLRDGMVANNVLHHGTVIMTKGFGELTVADTGGPNFDTVHRLDVFVPRNKGESDYRYEKRVNAMGIVKVKGYIVE